MLISGIPLAHKGCNKNDSEIPDQMSIKILKLLKKHTFCTFIQFIMGAINKT